MEGSLDTFLSRDVPQYCEHRVRNHRGAPVLLPYLPEIIYAVQDHLREEAPSLTVSERVEFLRVCANMEIAYCLDMDAYCPPLGDGTAPTNAIGDSMSQPPAVFLEGTRKGSPLRTALGSARSRFLLLYARRREQLTQHPSEPYTGAELLDDLTVLRDSCDLLAEPELACRLHLETDRLAGDRERRAGRYELHALDALCVRVLEGLGEARAVNIDHAFLLEIGIVPFDATGRYRSTKD